MNPPNPAPFLRGERIDLCILGPDADISDYFRWINDAETTRFMVVGTYPVTGNNLRDFIANHAASADILLGIFARSSKPRHVGNIMLHRIDRLNRKAELGLIMGDPSVRRRGYGLEAVTLMVRHAFLSLNLNKVCAGVVEGNAASEKLFEKAGFRFEGRMAEESFIEGEYRDNLRFGLLRKDWQADVDPGKDRKK